MTSSLNFNNRIIILILVTGCLVGIVTAITSALSLFLLAGLFVVLISFYFLELTFL